MIRITENIACLFIFCFLFSCSSSISEKNHPEKGNSRKGAELTPKDIEFISTIKDEIKFQFFVTGEIPDELKELENELKELMKEIHQHNPKINFAFTDPYALNEQERLKYMEDLYVIKKVPYSEVQMESNGRASVKFVFTGGIALYHGIESPFSLYKDPKILFGPELKKSSEAAIKNLKGKILKQIKKMVWGKVPKIAFLTGHGEANQIETHVVEREMMDSYYIERISIKSANGEFNLHALDDFDGLIICRPRQEFAQQEVFIIDQFIMKGGKTIWMIDPVFVDEEVLIKEGQTFGLAADYGLNEMFFNYGIRMNAELLLSESCAPIAISESTMDIFYWNFYPLLTPDTAFTPNTGINPVKLEYTGTLNFIGESENAKAISLLSVKEKSKTAKAPVRINSEMTKAENRFSHSGHTERIIALLVEGTFNSTFKNSIPEQYQLNESGFLAQSGKTKMVVIADGDLIINDTSTVYNTQSGKYETAYLKLEADKFQVRNADGTSKFQYGNLEFFMNILDEMMYDYPNQ